MAQFASTSVQNLTILTEDDSVPGSKFEKEPEEYTVTQLKRWLKCRGLKQSGKRSELISRVSDCIKAGNHRTLDVGIDEGKWFAAKVLKENSRINVSNNVLDIPIIPKTGWCAFQSKDIPSLFNYGHIYHYALESICTILTSTNDEEDDDQGLGHMTDKPLKNGRKYVDSGFVHNMVDAKTDLHYFVRAHVWPSMRSELPHNVLVVLSVASGAVIHASCDPCKVSALGRCSHVVAVLFSVLDHVNKHGPTLSTPCTSQECSWNKGKKREKNPQRLSDTNYLSKRKKGRIDVIDFDPRPIGNREIKPEHINKLVVNLQSLSTNTNGMSMWEVQLKMTYDDYELDNANAVILHELTNQLLYNLTPPKLMEIPGTQDQSKNEKWFTERWLRLTASKCLSACRVGQLIIEGAYNAAVRAFMFIATKVWKIGQEHFQSYWMKYGLDSEHKAVLKYEQQTQNKVVLTGLWVNPKFPFLACSPDGLVGNDGLIEIKSLKLFKDNSIESIAATGQASVSKNILDRQCFIVQDGKCVLKQRHEYFYQIQMQLLVTERNYCDFILYAETGPVSIERIERNERFISEILKYLMAFWKRVIAPETFEMRVPRGLHPFVLAETPSYPLDPGSVHNDNTVGPSTSVDPFTTLHPPTHDPGRTCDAGTTRLHPCATGDPTTTHDPGTKCYPGTTLSPGPACDPLHKSGLFVIPWGGVTSSGITLSNTCPLDNWLMIFQALIKERKINLCNLPETGHIISEVVNLIEQGKYSDAKLSALSNDFEVTSGIINLYGNESDYFVKHLRPYLCSKTTSKCDMMSCPCPNNDVNSCTTTLGFPSENSQGSSVFEKSLYDWCNPAISKCRRKFQDKPPPGTPYIEDVTLNESGNPEISWHCDGSRFWSERQFTYLKDFATFSVDLLSRGHGLKIADIPQQITLNGKNFYFHSATLWNGNHYICMFKLGNWWYLYDGMKEYTRRNSGLLSSHSRFPEPYGYSISYVVFIMYC